METPSVTRDRLERRILSVGFFLTGLTALVAEVVLNRLLRYVFGSSHEATATVLAAYMCGLSVGAFAFGRWSARLSRPLAAYGYLELVVALLYVATPTLYGAFHQLAIAASRGMEGDPTLLTATRFAASFAFVFLPTFFMGGTLPVLLAGFGAQDGLRSRLPALYAANTFGAAAGTLLAAYVLIRPLGLDGTLAFAGIVNALVGTIALVLSARQERDRGPTAAASPAPATPSDLETAVAAPPVEASLSEGAVVALAFAQGAIVFCLEVVWTHLIATVIGVTAYAFAVMLAAILIGIGIGSALIDRLGRRASRNWAAAFVIAEAALAVTVALTLPLWDRFPQVINLALDITPRWSFWAREAVRLSYCLLLLVPTTVCAGAALPALVTAAGRTRSSGESRLVGSVFGANTLGAIVGSLGAGFVLLGRVPSLAIFALAAFTALAVCGAALLKLRRPLPTALAPTCVVATALCAAVFGLFPGWDRARLTAGSHYYWTRWDGPSGDIVFFEEDPQSGLVSVTRAANGTQVLTTNGKYEVTDAPLEFQDFYAMIGGMYLRSTRRALVVGLGGGRTLSLLHEMPFEAIDVAEFSPAIIRAARERFATFVGPAMADPSVNVMRDDGRNRLQMTSQRYSLVVVGLTGAAVAGAGNLYTREFFEIVRSHLEPGGVFLLWVQLHHMEDRTVRSVLFTVRQVFPAVHFYSDTGGAQGFLVASESPLVINRALAARIGQGAHARRTLQAYGIASVEIFTTLNVFSTDEELGRYFSGSRPELLTDMRPSLEYAAPFGLALPIPGLNFQPLSARRLPAMEPPLSEGEASGLSGLRLLIAGDERAALRRFEESERLLGRPVWQAEIARIRSKYGIS